MAPHGQKSTRIEPSGLKKGSWSPDEDRKLIAYINRYRIWNWNQMPRPAGLNRSGKSCRLRWVNYLKPGVKRGNFSKEEDETIIELYLMLGTKWSAIAARLPGRTDNEIKNHWHTHLKKSLENNQTYNAPISPAPSSGGSCVSTDVNDFLATEADVDSSLISFQKVEIVCQEPYTFEELYDLAEDDHVNQTAFEDQNHGLVLPNPHDRVEFQKPITHEPSNNFSDPVNEFWLKLLIEGGMCGI